MKNDKTIFGLIILSILFIMLLFYPARLFAHCDGMDGPVVKAAQKALQTGNVNFVLIWVQKQDEETIRKAFQQAQSVRKLSKEAQDLADLYFFEIVVRIHRAGEGASYTGLKPAGRDLGPTIPAADKAVETGKIEPLVDLLMSKIRKDLEEHFHEVMARKSFDANNVEMGREFVRAYVEFIHYAERIFEATATESHGHYPDSEKVDMNEGH